MTTEVHLLKSNDHFLNSQLSKRRNCLKLTSRKPAQLDLTGKLSIPSSWADGSLTVTAKSNMVSVKYKMSRRLEYGLFTSCCIEGCSTSQDGPRIEHAIKVLGKFFKEEKYTSVSHMDELAESTFGIAKNQIQLVWDHLMKCPMNFKMVYGGKLVKFVFPEKSGYIQIHTATYGKTIADIVEQELFKLIDTSSRKGIKLNKQIINVLDYMDESYNCIVHSLILTGDVDADVLHEVLVPDEMQYALINVKLGLKLILDCFKNELETTLKRLQTRPMSKHKDHWRFYTNLKRVCDTMGDDLFTSDISAIDLAKYVLEFNTLKSIYGFKNLKVFVCQAILGRQRITSKIFDDHFDSRDGFSRCMAKHRKAYAVSMTNLEKYAGIENASSFDLMLKDIVQSYVDINYSQSWVSTKSGLSNRGLLSNYIKIDRLHHIELDAKANKLILLFQKENQLVPYPQSSHPNIQFDSKIRIKDIICKFDTYILLLCDSSFIHYIAIDHVLQPRCDSIARRLPLAEGHIAVAKAYRHAGSLVLIKWHAGVKTMHVVKSECVGLTEKWCHDFNGFVKKENERMGLEGSLWSLDGDTDLCKHEIGCNAHSVMFHCLVKDRTNTIVRIMVLVVNYNYPNVSTIAHEIVEDVPQNSFKISCFSFRKRKLLYSLVIDSWYNSMKFHIIAYSLNKFIVLSTFVKNQALSKYDIDRVSNLRYCFLLSWQYNRETQNLEAWRIQKKKNRDLLYLAKFKINV